ncbi:MAG: ATP-binding cassette domain-containing protein [Massiliimalia sp.]|jgi:cobalt/nickel transport system ATP-binding protein
MNIIETKDLCYSYGEGKLALDHVNIAVPQGTITAFLGGNGAGKSTLFLNLNGVLTPDSGQVLFDGQPVSYTKKGLAQMRRRVGIVFQDPNDQLFSASVLKDVSFGAVNLGLPEEEVRRRVEQAVAQTGIGEYLNSPTHALSFGQKKRVAIAGVLVMNPDVIILDEPTAGLDPAGVSEILRLILQIKEQRGISVILATHEIDLVPLYCDYVYLLDHGKVCLSGTPEEVFSQKDVVREHALRLPRIAHLMEILKEKDGLAVDETASTIAAARKTLLEAAEITTSKEENADHPSH